MSRSLDVQSQRAFITLHYVLALTCEISIKSVSGLNGRYNAPYSCDYRTAGQSENDAIVRDRQGIPVSAYEGKSNESFAAQGHLQAPDNWHW